MEVIDEVPDVCPEGRLTAAGRASGESNRRNVVDGELPGD